MPRWPRKPFYLKEVEGFLIGRCLIMEAKHDTCNLCIMEWSVRAWEHNPNWSWNRQTAWPALYPVPGGRLLELPWGSWLTHWSWRWCWTNTASCFSLVPIVHTHFTACERHGRADTSGFCPPKSASEDCYLSFLVKSERMRKIIDWSWVSLICFVKVDQISLWFIIAHVTQYVSSATTVYYIVCRLLHIVIKP